MSDQTNEKVSLKDLYWRVPAIAFCVWLAVSCAFAASSMEPLGVKIGAFISGVLWTSLGGSLVKASVKISMLPKDDEE